MVVETNEKDKVCDGEFTYTKSEYIDEVYPAMKADMREVHRRIKEHKHGTTN
jgi:hypothetical protein